MEEGKLYCNEEEKERNRGEAREGVSGSGNRKRGVRGESGRITYTGANNYQHILSAKKSEKWQYIVAELSFALSWGCE